jgi:predicted NodU family carbamoyl transferase
MVKDLMVYPESLGFIYTIIADHLQFGWIEGPDKLMGQAAYGQADPLLFKDLVYLKENPEKPVLVDISFFGYHCGDSILPPKTIERFGPRRSLRNRSQRTTFDWRHEHRLRSKRRSPISQKMRRSCYLSKEIFVWRG